MHFAANRIVRDNLSFRPELDVHALKKKKRIPINRYFQRCRWKRTTGQRVTESERLRK